MEKDSYTEEFYADLAGEEVEYSAEQTLSLVLASLPEINSVVDVGCGVGTWLKVLSELRDGKVEMLGIDGPWISRDWLVIPENRFLSADISLRMPSVDKKYDLAISLEVGEHLPREKAEDFVGFLAGISDFVLFSAAIPFQGGTGHLNEQWQDWWAVLFKREGFSPVDLVRPALWNDGKIRIHYRQNTILYARKQRIGEIRLPGVIEERMLSLSHPECYTKYAHPGVKRAFRMFLKSVGRSIAGRFGRQQTGGG